MITWWYAHGWNTFIHKLQDSLSNTVDFFSMSSLIRTLFKPYRQISAETAGANSSLDLKFHMFIDRLVSRIIGFFSRLVLLITGTVIILASSAFSLLLILLWPFIPLLPFAGVIMTIAGVTIWTIPLTPKIPVSKRRTKNTFFIILHFLRSTSSSFSSFSPVVLHL